MTQPTDEALQQRINSLIKRGGRDGIEIDGCEFYPPRELVPMLRALMVLGVKLSRDARPAPEHAEAGTFPRAPIDEDEREACDGLNDRAWCSKPIAGRDVDGATVSMECTRRPKHKGRCIAGSSGEPEGPQIHAVHEEAPIAPQPQRDGRPMLTNADFERFARVGWDAVREERGQGDEWSQMDRFNRAQMVVSAIGVVDDYGPGGWGSVEEAEAFEAAVLAESKRLPVAPSPPQPVTSTGDKRATLPAPGDVRCGKCGARVPHGFDGETLKLYPCESCAAGKATEPQPVEVAPAVDECTRATCTECGCKVLTTAAIGDEAPRCALCLIAEIVDLRARVAPPAGPVHGPGLSDEESDEIARATIPAADLDVMGEEWARGRIRGILSGTDDDFEDAFLDAVHAAASDLRARRKPVQAPPDPCTECGSERAIFNGRAWQIVHKAGCGVYAKVKAAHLAAREGAVQAPDVGEVVALVDRIRDMPGPMPAASTLEFIQGLQSIRAAVEHLARERDVARAEHESAVGNLEEIAEAVEPRNGEHVVESARRLRADLARRDALIDTAVIAWGSLRANFAMPQHVFTDDMTAAIDELHGAAHAPVAPTDAPTPEGT